MRVSVGISIKYHHYYYKTGFVLDKYLKLTAMDVDKDLTPTNDKWKFEIEIGIDGDGWDKIGYVAMYVRERAF